MTDHSALDQETQTIKLSHPDSNLVHEVRPDELPTWRTQGWREVKDDAPTPSDVPGEEPAEPAEAALEVAPEPAPENKRRSRATQTPAAPAQPVND